MAAGPAETVFYYDLGDPECYLAAELAIGALPGDTEWRPMLAVEIGGGRAGEPDVEDLARRARVQGLLPLRLPGAWPPRTASAALAATYAKQVGRAVAFSLAAFRQAFAGGRDLDDLDTLLLAGAACEIHPAALIKAIESRAVAAALRTASERARDDGIRELPAVVAGGVVFGGADAVAAAVRAGAQAA